MKTGRQKPFCGSAPSLRQALLANARLVAVLVCLDAAEHDHRQGSWFLECGFGRLQGIVLLPFDTLDAATRWLRRRMKP